MIFSFFLIWLASEDGVRQCALAARTLPVAIRPLHARSAQPVLQHLAAMQLDPDPKLGDRALCPV